MIASSMKLDFDFFHLSFNYSDFIARLLKCLGVGFRMHYERFMYWWSITTVTSVKPWEWMHAFWNCSWYSAKGQSIVAIRVQNRCIVLHYSRVRWKSVTPTARQMNLFVIRYIHYTYITMNSVFFQMCIRRENDFFKW